MKNRLSEYEMYKRYEKVRLSGKFNMITESAPAMKAADLTQDEYLTVIHDYSEYRDKYEAKRIIDEALEEPVPF